MTAARVQPEYRHRLPTALRGQVAAAGELALAVCAVLLLIGAPPAAAIEYYRSNAHGTRLARLAGDPAVHTGYTLAVDAPEEAQAAGLVARRRLLNAGSLVAEWRRRADGEGSVERELQANDVVAERRFGAGGRLLEERRFDAAGHLLWRAVLTYAGGALRSIHRYDGAGQLTATEEYELTSDGRLRGFSHTPAPAAESSDVPVTAEAPVRSILHFLFHRGELIEERRREGDGEVIVRFRDGEQRAAEWRGEHLVSERGAGARIDHAGGTRTETSVDAAGRVQSERVWDIADGDGDGDGGERLREERTYRYRADGSLVSMQVIGRAGLEVTNYDFGDDGRLVREQVRRRGRLVRVTSYPAPGERVEEVHARGNTVLRVIWRDGEPIREELLADGEVVRFRDLSPGAAPGDASDPGTS